MRERGSARRHDLDGARPAGRATDAATRLQALKEAMRAAQRNLKRLANLADCGGNAVMLGYIFEKEPLDAALLQCRRKHISTRASKHGANVIRTKEI